MRARKIQFKGGVLLLILLSTIVNAEGDNKKASSVIPSEEMQAGEVVHVIKLDDILEGKYSNDKVAPIKEEPGHTVEKQATDKVVQKVVQTKIKPVVNNGSSLDILEAYDAIMGYPKGTHKSVKKALVKKPSQPKIKQVAGRKVSGWLYLGRFSQGQWDQLNNQVLGLKGTLPKVGQRYSIRAYSNVRQSYPSKKGMPPIVKVLPQGSSVKLLAVHNSGGSGHYWAKVQWFKF